MTLKRYHRPPDNYRPPERCKSCRRLVMLTMVVGGRKWVHVVKPDDGHEVTLGRPWWDATAGEFRTEIMAAE